MIALETNRDDARENEPRCYGKILSFDVIQ
jgi:hypothetical protein